MEATWRHWSAAAAHPGYTRRVPLSGDLGRQRRAVLCEGEGAKREREAAVDAEVQRILRANAMRWSDGEDSSGSDDDARNNDVEWRAAARERVTESIVTGRAAPPVLDDAAVGAAEGKFWLAVDDDDAGGGVLERTASTRAVVAGVGASRGDLMDAVLLQRGLRGKHFGLDETGVPTSFQLQQERGSTLPSSSLRLPTGHHDEHHAASAWFAAKDLHRTRSARNAQQQAAGIGGGTAGASASVVAQGSIGVVKDEDGDDEEDEDEEEAAVEVALDAAGHEAVVVKQAEQLTSTLSFLGLDGDSAPLSPAPLSTPATQHSRSGRVEGWRDASPQASNALRAPEVVPVVPDDTVAPPQRAAEEEAEPVGAGAALEAASGADTDGGDGDVESVASMGELASPASLHGDDDDDDDGDGEEEMVDDDAQTTSTDPDSWKRPPEHADTAEHALFRSMLAAAAAAAEISSDEELVTADAADDATDGTAGDGTADTARDVADDTGVDARASGAEEAQIVVEEAASATAVVDDSEDDEVAQPIEDAVNDPATPAQQVQAPLDDAAPGASSAEAAAVEEELPEPEDKPKKLISVVHRRGSHEAVKLLTPRCVVLRALAEPALDLRCTLTLDICPPRRQWLGAMASVAVAVVKLKTPVKRRKHRLHVEREATDALASVAPAAQSLPSTAGGERAAPSSLPSTAGGARGAGLDGRPGTTSIASELAEQGSDAESLGRATGSAGRPHGNAHLPTTPGEYSDGDGSGGPWKQYNSPIRRRAAMGLGGTQGTYLVPGRGQARSHSSVDGWSRPGTEESPAKRAPSHTPSPARSRNGSLGGRSAGGRAPGGSAIVPRGRLRSRNIGELSRASSALDGVDDAAGAHRSGGGTPVTASPRIDATSVASPRMQRQGDRRGSVDLVVTPARSATPQRPKPHVARLRATEYPLRHSQATDGAAAATPRTSRDRQMEREAADAAMKALEDDEEATLANAGSNVSLGHVDHVVTSRLKLRSAADEARDGDGLRSAGSASAGALSLAMSRSIHSTQSFDSSEGGADAREAKLLKLARVLTAALARAGVDDQLLVAYEKHVRLHRKALLCVAARVYAGSVHHTNALSCFVCVCRYFEQG